MWLGLADNGQSVTRIKCHCVRVGSTDNGSMVTGWAHRPFLRGKWGRLKT